MSIARLLLPEFDEEMAATGRVLERVPSNQYTWKPHPHSMSLHRLAMHVAEALGMQALWVEIRSRVKLYEQQQSYIAK